MRIETKGLVSFKEWVVFRLNIYTGETALMQDFDRLELAQERAEIVSMRGMIGVVFRFESLGIDESCDVIDSQEGERAQREQQRRGNTNPIGILKN